VSLRFLEAFRAEVDERAGDGDFAGRAEVALALANERVRAELTADCALPTHKVDL